jgi:hypothetical protein
VTAAAESSTATAPGLSDHATQCDASGANDKGATTMHKILRTIGATLVIALVIVATSAAPASALGFGYGQIGGYERGGYEYSS